MSKNFISSEWKGVSRQEKSLKEFGIFSRAFTRKSKQRNDCLISVIGSHFGEFSLVSGNEGLFSSISNFSCCWSTFSILMDNSVNGGQWNIRISFLPLLFDDPEAMTFTMKGDNLALLGEWWLLASISRGHHA